jgi:hypothetical protein
VSELRRVLVFGGRDYRDRPQMESALQRILRDGDVVVHGGARGADHLAGDIGQVLGHHVEVYPADWGRWGKGAGPIRNQQMLNSGIDLAVEFPGGRGTRDMARRLDDASIPTVRVDAVPDTSRVDHGPVAPTGEAERRRR